MNYVNSVNHVNSVNSVNNATISDVGPKEDLGVGWHHYLSISWTQWSIALDDLWIKDVCLNNDATFILDDLVSCVCSKKEAP